MKTIFICAFLFPAALSATPILGVGFGQVTADLAQNFDSISGVSPALFMNAGTVNPGGQGAFFSSASPITIALDPVYGDTSIHRMGGSGASLGTPDWLTISAHAPMTGFAVRTGSIYYNWGPQPGVQALLNWETYADGRLTGSGFYSQPWSERGAVFNLTDDSGVFDAVRLSFTATTFGLPRSGRDIVVDDVTFSLVKAANAVAQVPESGSSFSLLAVGCLAALIAHGRKIG